MIRLIGYFVSLVFTGFLLVAGGIWIAVSAIEPDLPDFTGLADYEPPVLSRLYPSRMQSLFACWEVPSSS